MARHFGCTRVARRWEDGSGVELHRRFPHWWVADPGGLMAYPTSPRPADLPPGRPRKVALPSRPNQAVQFAPGLQEVSALSSERLVARASVDTARVDDQHLSRSAISIRTGDLSRERSSASIRSSGRRSEPRGRGGVRRPRCSPGGTSSDTRQPRGRRGRPGLPVSLRVGPPCAAAAGCSDPGWRGRKPRACHRGGRWPTPARTLSDRRGDDAPPASASIDRQVRRRP